MPLDRVPGQSLCAPLAMGWRGRVRICRGPPAAFPFPGPWFLTRKAWSRGRSPIFSGSERYEENAMTDRALRAHRRCIRA